MSISSQAYEMADLRRQNDLLREANRVLKDALVSIVDRYKQLVTSTNSDANAALSQAQHAMDAYNNNNHNNFQNRYVESPPRGGSRGRAVDDINTSVIRGVVEKFAADTTALPQPPPAGAEGYRHYEARMQQSQPQQQQQQYQQQQQQQGPMYQSPPPHQPQQYTHNNNNNSASSQPRQSSPHHLQQLHHYQQQQQQQRHSSSRSQPQHEPSPYPVRVVRDNSCTATQHININNNNNNNTNNNGSNEMVVTPRQVQQVTTQYSPTRAELRAEAQRLHERHARTEEVYSILKDLGTSPPRSSRTPTKSHSPVYRPYVAHDDVRVCADGYPQKPSSPKKPLK